MISIDISTEKGYPLSKKVLASKLKNFFAQQGIVSDAEVSVFIVSAASMTEYAKKYLHETEKEASEHPVLSFVQSEIEGEFQFPPDDVLHLGEIIVSYDHAKKDAVEKNQSVDESIWLLVEHAGLHLMGHHHD